MVKKICSNVLSLMELILFSCE